MGERITTSGLRRMDRRVPTEADEADWARAAELHAVELRELQDKADAEAAVDCDRKTRALREMFPRVSQELAERWHRSFSAGYFLDGGSLVSEYGEDRTMDGIAKELAHLTKPA